MKIFFLISAAYLSLGCLLENHVQTDNAGYSIAREMIASNNLITTLSYTLSKTERIDGYYVKQSSSCKIRLNPFTVYIKQHAPKEGLEVLFTPEPNKSLYVNPAGFPWFNLYLDPMGSTARSEQHHTVYQSGFNYFGSILKHLMDKYGSATHSMVQRLDDEDFNGRECYSLKFTNPHFKYVQYTVLSNETLIEIAKKFHLSEHMILEHNQNISSYSNVSQGQRIQIPNDYCKEMTILIDKKKMYPIRVKVYDEIGLYEQYEYTNVSINPQYKENEFSKNYPEYDF